MTTLVREKPTINEMANFQNYINERELTQAKLAKDLDILPQMISRVLQQSNKRDKLPPALKLALLKKYYYDVETNREVNYTPQSNVTRIPFFPYCDIYSQDDMTDSMCFYFDTRWITNVLKLEPSNLVMFQIKDQCYDDICQLYHLNPINKNDILMIDRSTKTTYGIAYFLVKHKNQYLIKCLDMSWDGNDIHEIINTKSKINNLLSKSNKERVKPFNQSNNEIIGKVVWNGNFKFI